LNAEYQYLLEGFQDDWSGWSTKTAVSFKNLPSGQYVFKVRTKFAKFFTGSYHIYSFILKPWYRSTKSLFFYLIIGIVFTRIIDKAYRSYYQRKDKLIEENNRLLEIKEQNGREYESENEQLSLDVDTKSRELAVSAMSLNNKMNCWLLLRMT
jgi:hypothetical protein